MNSVTTERFRLLFASAPPERQARIKAAYRQWAQNPTHPSLRFKEVHPHLPIYSVRVDLASRAVAVLESDTLVWFWVGPHPQYEALLKSL